VNLVSVPPSDADSDLEELEAGIREQLAASDRPEEQARYTRWLSLIGSFRAPMNLTDVSDLLPELIRELNLPTDKLESQIMALLRFVGEPVDLDQILIGLYRRFGVIQKRRFLQNKLWRMVSKKQIYKGKNRKGVYALEPVDVHAGERGREARRGPQK
jgi:hypothetical protein